MNHPRAQSTSTRLRQSCVLLCAWATVAVANQADAGKPFIYKGEPVHPACVQALAMQQGDAVPVATAVSLEGCAASERSRSRVQYKGNIASFEDEALMGAGSFGYRELVQLDNGIFALVIRRVLPDGEERVSLAAVEIVERPMLRGGSVVNVQLLELLGEVWIRDMQMASFRSVGNVVHFSAGVGRDRVDRTVDLTRLGRMRK